MVAGLADLAETRAFNLVAASKMVLCNTNSFRFYLEQET
jgi:hypothetical protein